MIFWFSAWIAKAKQLKGSQRVVGEDGGPAEEEDRHDQDQHVDHLGHHDDDVGGGEEEDGDDDNDRGQTEQEDQDQHVDHLGKWMKLNLKQKIRNQDSPSSFLPLC